MELIPCLDNLATRCIAMPSDTNPLGDIFGGWLLSQMDLAGANIAMARTKCPVVTVAVDSLSFHNPVFVGDEVSCYGIITKIGRTSIKVQVDMWVRRHDTGESHRVTEGLFTFVAIDQNRKPTPIAPISFIV